MTRCRTRRAPILAYPTIYAGNRTIILDAKPSMVGDVRLVGGKAEIIGRYIALAELAEGRFVYAQHKCSGAAPTKAAA